MTTRNQKKTQAAREALALRRSSRQFDKKRGHNEEPESETPPPTIRKRIRSGTLTEQAQAPTDDSQAISPSSSHPRPRARPRIRLPRPENESDNEPNQHSPIELPANTKLIVMTGCNHTSPSTGAANETIASNPVTEGSVLEVKSGHDRSPIDTKNPSLDTDIIMLGKKVRGSTPKQVDTSQKEPTELVERSKLDTKLGSKSIPKARISHESDNEEDDWNRDGRAGSEDSDVDDQSEKKKEHNRKIMLEYEVPRFKGAVRILKLSPSASYWRFRHETGDIVENASDKLQWGYSAGRRKDLKGKLTPRVIENEDDYKEMVDVAVEAINKEHDRYEKETRLIEEAAKAAKGKRGAPSKKKAAPIEEYVIRLVVIEADENTYKKGRKLAGREKKSAAVFGNSDHGDDDTTMERTIAGKQLTWMDKLRTKRFCGTHRRHCALIPGATRDQPGRCVRLEKKDLLQWSEALANSAPGVSLFVAPAHLKLQERPSDGDEETSNEVKPDPQNVPVAAAPQAPVPPPHHQFPAMFYPGWPPYYPPPPPGTNGYPPNPYGAPPPPPSAPKAQPSADPLLSEWLVQCDLHEIRGADQHQFASFLPQFNSCRLTRISDIARFATPDLLRDAISENFPKMPYGTAARLLDYAKADYQ